VTIERWPAAVALLCGAAIAGCADGTSNGDSSGPGGGAGADDSIEASPSGHASSGEPTASAGSTSGAAIGESSGGTAGTSRGSPGGGSGNSSSGSASGSRGGDIASGSGSPGGSLSGSVAASGADGGPPSDAGGSPCQSGPLYPIAAIASSVADPSDAGTTFVAQNAIDNNFATRWESTFRVDPASITLDFGFQVHIGELDILWNSDCASAYDIDISDDGSAWTTLKSITANPASSQAAPSAWMNDDVETIASVGRYVRVHGTRRAQSQFGYSIWEMRALGDRNASCTP
jgi:hypothetical protein